MHPSHDSSSEMIGHYRKIKKIDNNLDDKVYLSHDPEGREVIIREIENADRFRARFNELMPKLAALKHPNIVETLDFGEHSGVLYQVCEYVPGGSLHSELYRLNQSNKLMRIEGVLMLVRDAALALELAHSKELVHGNIQPKNFLIERTDGSKNFLGKLTDFGLNQIYARPIQNLNDLLGSPMYMAPEQFQGLPLTPQTDIYSLGIIFYELATGKLPFQDESIRDLAGKHIYDEPESPETVINDLSLPQGLNALILRTLKKSPNQRFATARDFARAVDEIIDNIEEAKNPGDRNTKRLTENFLIPSTPPDIPSVDQPSKYPRILVFDSRATTVPKSFELVGSESVYTIGRNSNSNFVLDDPYISRAHLIARWDSQQVLISRAGSTIPPYLFIGSREELQTQVEVVWPWRSAMYLHPYWLHLDPPQNRISISGPDAINLIPGEPTSVKISLKNIGVIVDTFTIEVEGIPKDWLQSIVEVPLNPDSDSTCSLSFLVPNCSQVGSGQYEGSLLVRSKTDPKEVKKKSISWGVHQLLPTPEPPIPPSVTVKPRIAGTLLLSPSQTQTHRITILTARLTNSNSEATEYVLDHNRNVDFSVEFFSDTQPQETIIRKRWTIQPNETIEVSVRVVFPTKYFGNSTQHSLEVSARPVESSPEVTIETCSARVQITHHAILPTWVPWVMALFLLMFGAIFIDLDEPSIEKFEVNNATLNGGSYVIGMEEPISINYEVLRSRSIEMKVNTSTDTSVLSLEPQETTKQLTAFTEPGRRTITLVARGWIRQKTKELIVDVRAKPIVKLEVTPTDVLVGEKITFKWKTEHANTLTLSLSGDVIAPNMIPNSEKTIDAPNRLGEYEYTITAQGDFGGPVSDTVRVRVRGLPVSIESFKATKNVNQIEFSWNAQNFDRLSLQADGLQIRILSTSEGNTSIEAPQTNTTYSLIATSSSGETTIQEVVVIGTESEKLCSESHNFPLDQPVNITELSKFDRILGTGKEVADSDTVQINVYTWLDNGDLVFVNCPSKNGSLRFRIGENTFISGLDEGVRGMKVGGRRFISVPSDKAYGEKGVIINDKIVVPPNTALVYMVELVTISR